MTCFRGDNSQSASSTNSTFEASSGYKLGSVFRECGWPGYQWSAKCDVASWINRSSWLSRRDAFWKTGACQTIRDSVDVTLIDNIFKYVYNMHSLSSRYIYNYRVLYKFNCINSNIIDKSSILQVMWLRRNNDWASLLLLTLGNATHTSDSRYSVSFQYPNNWRLAISGVRREDHGVYVCQVNTHPPRMLVTNVTVLGNTTCFYEGIKYPGQVEKNVYV